MADTYCGKTCGQCIKKQNDECVGCLTENLGGKSTECEVAKCCKELHHSSCFKCGTRENCTKYHSAKTPKAPILAKLIGLLFWTMIASVLASVLTLDMTLEIMPSLELPGFVLGVVISVIYAVILLILSKTSHSYQLAGICWIVSQVFSVVSYVIGKDNILNTVLKILALIIVLVASYSEFDAHANVLYDVDNGLADKWRTLWNMTVCARLAMILGIVLLFIMMNLGANLVILGSLGILVVDILKFVYLYMTSKAFKKISDR